MLKEIISGSGKIAKLMASIVKNDPQIGQLFGALPVASFAIENNKMKFSIVGDESLNLLNIISDNFENVFTKIGASKKTYYNKYVDDWRPRTIVTDFLQEKSRSIEIFDNKPRMLPVYNLSAVGKILGMSWPDNVDVCLPQYVLMYYLQKYFGGGFIDSKLASKNNPVFIQMYNATKQIVEIAEKIYISLKNISPKTGSSDDPVNPVDPVDAVFEQLPFFLTAKMYGSFNWSPDYIVGVREQNYFINYVPIAEQEIMKPPRGYYRKEPPAKFDPSKSPFFQFDGLECDPFKPVELFPVREKPATAKPGIGMSPKTKKYLSWEDVDF